MTPKLPMGRKEPTGTRETANSNWTLHRVIGHAHTLRLRCSPATHTSRFILALSRPEPTFFAARGLAGGHLIWILNPEFTA